MTAFGVYTQCYELLYGDKDYAAEARFVERLLEKYAPQARNLLEFGCGGGQHAEHLAASGFAVLGLDRSQGMIDLATARCRGLSASHAARLAFTFGDIRTIRIEDRFDAVVSLFHVFSYQTSDSDLDAAIETAVNHLRPEGLLLFDFWYGPAVLAQTPTLRVKRVENERLAITRISEPSRRLRENVVDVRYEVFVREKQTGHITRIEETHPMRYFFLEELESALAARGFVTLGFQEWMTGAVPSPSTWSIICVATRRKAS